MAPVRVLAPVRMLAATSTAVAITLLSVTASYANPAPAPGDIDTQIDQQWNALEPIIEQYNTVHAQLAANKVRAEQLDSQLGPLELQMDLALGRVGDIATGVYMNGPMSSLGAMLSEGSPATFAERLTLLNMVARDQRRQIDNVVAVRDKYAGDKKALEDLISQQAEQDGVLAAKKQQIEDEIGRLQKLRQAGTPAAGAGTGSLRPTACPAEYVGGPGGTAAAKACGLIGKPYIWAGAGPVGYDCSGLTMTAWSAAGVRLDHSARNQKSRTKGISRGDLRPGDLIFFYRDIHHVAIYVGDGWFVHAPHTGDFVRMAQLTGYYAGNVSGYGRPSG
ncbi:MAG: peptidoglycan DL-endopeptidase CwlO [Micromonosporaceae bacterium]|nr:peptidoglycan DL-endopeptidase CwlO [Micromonosporaceae bacterium]